MQMGPLVCLNCSNCVAHPSKFHCSPSTASVGPLQRFQVRKDKTGPDYSLQAPKFSNISLRIELFEATTLAEGKDTSAWQCFHTFMLFSQINFIFPVTFQCCNHSFLRCMIFSLSPSPHSSSASLWNSCSKNISDSKGLEIPFLVAALYLGPNPTNFTVPEILASKRVHSREYHSAKKWIIVPFQENRAFWSGVDCWKEYRCSNGKKTPTFLIFSSYYCLLPSYYATC